ncbi:MAG: hypothetical protein ACFB11_24850 [Paracoccaceae bacterium]
MSTSAFWRPSRGVLGAGRSSRFHNDYGVAVSDIGLALQARATRSTAAYVQERMSDVQSVRTWEDVHQTAMRQITREGGLLWKLGVFSGKTINYIAHHLDDTVRSICSFKGSPTAWLVGYPPDASSGKSRRLLGQTLPCMSGFLNMRYSLL